MLDSDSPGDEYFRQHGASQAELQAMRDGRAAGATLAEMEAFTMNEACEQAQAFTASNCPSSGGFGCSGSNRMTFPRWGVVNAALPGPNRRLSDRLRPRPPR